MRKMLPLEGEGDCIATAKGGWVMNGKDEERRIAVAECRSG